MTTDDICTANEQQRKENETQKHGSSAGNIVTLPRDTY